MIRVQIPYRYSTGTLDLGKIAVIAKVATSGKHQTTFTTPVIGDGAVFLGKQCWWANHANLLLGSSAAKQNPPKVYSSKQ